MYEMNSRRYERLPSGLEDAIRRIGYGLIGLGTGISWKPRPIIVLSHMRAGSSLLSRVLAAHPEIAGYGELHLPYRRRLDFVAARGKVARVDSPTPTNARFWLDKVLHPWLLERDDWKVLIDQRPKVIFLLRAPGPTVRSLMGSFGMSESESVEYYASRAEELAWFGTKLSDRLESVFIEYSDLTEHTDQTLETLGSYLELGGPLSATYGSDSSVRGVDPSANLSAGVILSTEDKPVRHDEDSVPLQTQDLLDSVFADARTALVGSSRTVR